jgi:hypothetical protein
VVTGGVEYVNPAACHRIGLDSIHLFAFSNNFRECKSTKLAMSNAPFHGLSSHGMCVKDQNIYILGGFKSGAIDNRYPLISGDFHCLDLQEKEIVSFTESASGEGCTAGATVVPVGETILLLGGTNKSVTLFTNQEISADKCTMAAKCIIDSTDISPIPWVQCDGCDDWYHIFCLSKTNLPPNDEKKDWHCDKCNIALKKSKRQKQK